MNTHALIAAAVASVLLLAGCAPEPTLPAPMTEAEAQKMMDEQNRQWWTSMFPDEPMPVIEPIEYLDINDPGTRPTDCFEQAEVASTDLDPSADAARKEAADRARFVCAMQYPYDLSDPASLGILTDAQLAWVWSYNQKRLAPCLQLLGFAVSGRSGDYVPGSNTFWSPYFDMVPAPQTEAEWARIDQRCPPSPIGPLYRPSYG